MRYGDILPEGFNVPTSAFWLRKDLTVDGNPFKLVDVREGDVVMDCGSYIGTFAAAALEQGAASVTCYEAAPKNAALLVENVARYGDKVTVVEAALVATDAERVTLTMSGFSGANSVLPSENRKKSIEVKAINFAYELRRLQPQIVKLDVEGAEYDLLSLLYRGDLASVRCLFVEFHPIFNREVRIEDIRRYLAYEGFTIASTRKRAFVARKD